MWCDSPESPCGAILPNRHVVRFSRIAGVERDSGESRHDDLADQMRIGGLGLHFIRNLMDEVTYTADRRHGNQLVMVKKLQKDGDQ